MMKGSTFKNILVTLPRRHSEQWAYDMSVVVQKIPSRFLPQSVGSSLGPMDEVLPNAPLHSCLQAAVNVSPSTRPLLSSQASIKVRYFKEIKYAGQTFSVTSGVQLAEVVEHKNVVTHACITKLMQLDNNDMLWVAELAPVRGMMACMGVLTGIMPTHDLAPSPKRTVWLNAKTLAASNIVRPGKCGPGRDDVCWVIPQN